MALATDQSQGVAISGQTIIKLRLTDDVAVLTDSAERLQQQINNIRKQSTRFGLQINTNKTEVQIIARYPDKIKEMIDDTPLNQVDKFVYLGGSITSMKDIEEDVARRISLAPSDSRSLARIWKSRRICSKTKICIYEMLISLPTL